MTFPVSNGEVKTKIISVHQLTEEQIRQMFGVMNEYYNKVTPDCFRADLLEKQKVILLLRADGSICGFSTIVERALDVGGRRVIALFSGDTVLEKKSWGNGSLPMAFGRYLIRLKLRYPLTPVYWFLISKGYKTYLLMTNNFPVHFPRYDVATPANYQSIMDCFYRDRFGERYEAREGIIRFEDDKATSIREQVAEITDDLRQDPKVKYFVARNPDWRNGVELACVAKVTLWIPARYVLKRLKRSVSWKRKSPMAHRSLA